MTGKVRSIVEHMDEIDGMINQASKNWKTTRMAKAELSILRLLHMRSSMRMIFRYLYPLMRQLNWQNYTDQIPLRAFGVVEHPDWADFQYFLEDRCFPKTRDHAKEILRELGVPFYDPLLIIEKTKGRMEGDHQWILILKKEECR